MRVEPTTRRPPARIQADPVQPRLHPLLAPEVVVDLHPAQLAVEVVAHRVRLLLLPHREPAVAEEAAVAVAVT